MEHDSERTSLGCMVIKMDDLRYNPIFVPGDVLSVVGFPGTGMVMGTRVCNALDEVLEGKQYRYYQLLYYLEEEGFVYGEFTEMFLKQNAEKVKHVNYGEMMYEMRDIAEVYHENMELKLLVNSLR